MDNQVYSYAFELEARQMMREWLPHLVLANVALFLAVSGGIYLSMSDQDQANVEQHWSDFMTPLVPHKDTSETANQTLEIRMPPRQFMVWGTIGMTLVAGFYLAAALAGYVHRTEV